MSLTHVERVLDRLVTDEAFRRRFAAAPRPTLEELMSAGIELTPCELHVLAALDAELVARSADRLDPRIQKCDLHDICARARPAPGSSPSD